MVSRQHLKEKQFEKEICQDFEDQGFIWTNTKDNNIYSTRYGLVISDTLEYMRKSFPDEYDKLLPEGMDKQQQEKVIEEFSNHLSKELETQQKGKAQKGLLKLLMNGTRVSVNRGKYINIKNFIGLYNDPLVETSKNEYDNNIFRVMQQVRVDENSNETIDIVIFVNGFPIFSMELKSDYQQSVVDAIEQYKNDRIPSPTRKLLIPGRLFAHFAVSNDEVYMTTYLEGKETRFVPFNKGDEDGRAGNPFNPHGHNTDYLWKDYLSSDNIISLIKNYILVEPAKKGLGERYILPRYHQYRAVENVIRDIHKNGRGNSYLLAHSTGAGKTKTISWLAKYGHTEYIDESEKMFKDILLISDRTSLDKNIVEAIKNINAHKGVVVNIDNLHGKSKSQQLHDILKDKGSHIITCTVQTFPVLLGLLTSENFSNNKYCLIIDEAHSSQSGKVASDTIEVLAHNRLETTGDIDVDLEQLESDIANAKNITTVAFTGTPKPETLVKFGTEVVNPENRSETIYVPFDTYTMAQAISEGFVKDVTKQLFTLDMGAEIVDDLNRSDLVDSNEATNSILRWARTHDETIEEKARRVIEHMLKNVVHEIGGQAKAMVAVDSRKSCYKWFKALIKVAEEMGVSHLIKPLAAFSGQLNIGGSDEFPEHITEKSLNKKYYDKTFGDIGKEFSEGDYNILVVANKYQTGYDEPRLIALYVDKFLKNAISLVQLVSRLNRVFPHKPDPMIIDFINKKELYEKSFKKYVGENFTIQSADVNEIDDIYEEIYASGFINKKDVDSIANVFMNERSQQALESSEGAGRIVYDWKKEYRDALHNNDQETIDDCKTFKANIKNFLDAYNFFSQIFEYGLSEYHKLAIVCSAIVNRLNIREENEVVNYCDGLRLKEIEFYGDLETPEDINIFDEDNSSELIVSSFKPQFEKESISENDSTKPFDSVVESVNDTLRGILKDNENIEEPDTNNITITIVTKLMNDEEFLNLVEDLSPEELRYSQKLERILERIIFGILGAYKEIGDKLLEDEFMDKFKDIVAVYAKNDMF